MPLMMPLAIDGAAPRTTTNRIVRFLELEEEDREREPRDRRHRLQPGDHRSDRRAQHRDARDRDTEDAADDHGARRSPGCRARSRHRTPDAAMSPRSCQRRSNTVNGDGRRNSGFHADHTTICQRQDDDRDGERASATVAAQIAPRQVAPVRLDGRRGASAERDSTFDDQRSRRPRRTSSRSWSVIVAARVADLGRVDAAGPGMSRRRLRQPARAGWRAARRGRRGVPPRARCGSRRGR